MDYTTAVVVEAIDKEGYSVTAWTSDVEELELTVAEDKKSVSFAMPANDATLTATYEVNKYMLTINDVEYGEFEFAKTVPIALPVMPNKEITFDWENCQGITEDDLKPVLDDDQQPKPGEYSFVMPAEAVILKWEYTDKTYELTVYDAEGGETKKYVAADTRVTEKAPEKEGYGFDKWEITGITVSNPRTVTLAFYMPAKAVTLRPTYTISSYKLSVVSEGEYTLTKKEAETDVEIASGDAVVYATPVTATASDKEGYTFTGWTAKAGEEDVELKDGDGNAIDLANAAISFIMPPTDLTLTAIYTVNSYMLTVASEGEYTLKLGEEETEKAENDQYDVDYATVVTAIASDKEGYAFNGWTADDEELELTASEDGMTVSFTMPAKAVTLTASYTINSYTLTVASENGYTLKLDDVETEKAENDQYDVNCATAVTAIASDKEGYTFSGWTAKSGEEDVELKDGEGNVIDLANASISFAMPAGDVELTANYRIGTSYPYELVPGWNYIAIMRELDEESIEEILAENPYVLDTETMSFAKAEAADLVGGATIMLFSLDSRTLTIYGTAIDWKFPALNTGWNLVGICQDREKDQCPPANIWQWEHKKYEPVTGKLEAGKAYWFFIEE